MRTQVTPENVEKANSQFWEQMLGMRLERIGPGSPAGADSASIDHLHVMGCCELAGVWSGLIEVRLSMGLAQVATAAMLMQVPEAVLSEDLLDATKEIANMIAGTIKSVLPRPCTMTVPHAEIENRDVSSLDRTPGVLSVYFENDAGTLLVRVCETGVEASIPEPKSAQSWMRPVAALA